MTLPEVRIKGITIKQFSDITIKNYDTSVFYVHSLKSFYKY